MRRVLAFLAALISGVAGVPAVAETPVAAQGQWSRIATPDGTIAASFPCARADRKEIAQGAVYFADCDYHGVEYIAQLGGAPSGSTAGSYAEVLASARKDPTAGQIVEKTFGGRPSFTAIRPAKDGVGYGLFVDYAPGKLVTLLAFEPDGDNKLTGAARDAAVADARRFVASLELPAK